MAEPALGFRVTERAKEDLLCIGRYTERVWGKKQRDKYLGELDACFRWLALNPRLGRHRPEIHPGYYSYPQGAHVVFYVINGKMIDIIGIPHRSMDIDRFF